MKVIFHPEMRRDLRKILEFYDERSDSAGDRFFAAFENAVAEIKEHPTKFHRLDKFRRRCNLKRFPYHLVFELVGETIFISVLRHHKRHPSFGLRRRWK